MNVFEGRPATDASSGESTVAVQPVFAEARASRLTQLTPFPVPEAAGLNQVPRELRSTIGVARTVRIVVCGNSRSVHQSCRYADTIVAPGGIWPGPVPMICGKSTSATYPVG